MNFISVNDDSNCLNSILMFFNTNEKGYGYSDKKIRLRDHRGKIIH